MRSFLAAALLATVLTCYSPTSVRAACIEPPVYGGPAANGAGQASPPPAADQGVAARPPCLLPSPQSAGVHPDSGLAAGAQTAPPGPLPVTVARSQSPIPDNLPLAAALLLALAVCLWLLAKRRGRERI
jgi:hypothetical protein